MTHPDASQESPASPSKDTGAGTQHNAAHGHAAGSDPFPPAELATLHAEDTSAASHIVGLMLGIFTIGIILYLAVCYVVAGS